MTHDDSVLQKQRDSLQQALASLPPETRTIVDKVISEFNKIADHALDLSVKTDALTVEATQLRVQLATAQVELASTRDKLDRIMTVIAEARLQEPDAPMWVEYGDAGNPVKAVLAPHVVRGLFKAIDTEVRKIAGKNSYERVADAESKQQAAESALEVVQRKLEALQASADQHKWLRGLCESELHDHQHKHQVEADMVSVGSLVRCDAYHDAQGTIAGMDRGIVRRHSMRATGLICVETEDGNRMCWYPAHAVHVLGG